MITSRFYSEKREVKIKGENKVVDVPPPIVLSQRGPGIEIRITHPRIIQKNMKGKKQNIPYIQTIALIDTGAPFLL